jgi:hypothetical protein
MAEASFYAIDETLDMRVIVFLLAVNFSNQEFRVALKDLGD